MFNVFEKIEILYWRKKENDEKQGKFIRIRKGSQKLAEVVCFTINHGFVGGTAVISKPHEISEIRIKLPLAFWNLVFLSNCWCNHFERCFLFAICNLSKITNNKITVFFNEISLY